MAKKKGTLTGAVQQKSTGYSRDLDELKAKLSGEEEAAEPTKRLNAELPISLHIEFKARAVREGRNMSDVLKDLIHEYLSR